MDRLDAGLVGRAQDVGDAQVAVRGKRASDLHTLVHSPTMERSAIRFREDANAMDAHLPRGPRDANRDLTAVRNQQPAEHRVPSTTGCSRSEERRVGKHWTV